MGNLANIGFDSDTVPPASGGSFDVLPPAEYLVQIVASEMKENSKGTGSFLWLELEVMDGEFTGRKLWDQLNLINANADTQQWAQETLSAICHAVGVRAQDSDELHFIELVARVLVKPADANYEAKNKIKGYKPASEYKAARVAPTRAGTQAAARPATPANRAAAKPGGTPAARPAATPPARAAAAAVDESTPPWKRKRLAG